MARETSLENVPDVRRRAGPKPPPPGPGRPRDETARLRILDAALQIANDHGVDAVTTSRIAEDAGVGKQTVYRWWRARGPLLLEALRDSADAGIRPRRQTDARRELAAFLRATVRIIAERHGPALAVLAADAQRDPRLIAELREQLIAPRRLALRRILERCVEQGHIREDADFDLLLDLAYGPIWYRLMIGHLPLDRRFAEALTAAVLAAG